MINITKHITTYTTNNDEYIIKDMKIKVFGITIWASSHDFSIIDETDEIECIGYKLNRASELN